MPNLTNLADLAIGTVPLILGNFVNGERWFEARKVKRPGTAIAAKEPTDTIATVAVVVVELGSATCKEEGGGGGGVLGTIS